MNIIPYITFNGNCREAMSFYKSCLGGKLSFHTLGESPMADIMPEKMKGLILNAVLEKDNFKLMASDIVNESGLTRGNTISLLLNCNSEAEIHEYYSKLSMDGETTHSIQKNNWGALSGDLLDKYGNQWMLYYQPQ